MDKTSHGLAGILATLVDCSPQWPRSDALGRAEALAQELLSVLRSELEPDMLIDRRGRRPHITTMSQWRQKFYNKNSKIKALTKTGWHFEVQPPTGKSLARQRWPFRHALRSRVWKHGAGSLHLTTSAR